MRSEACFGWSWDEVRGQRLSDLIVPPEFRAAHEDGPVALPRHRRRPGARPPHRGRRASPRRPQLPGRAVDHRQRTVWRANCSSASCATFPTARQEAERQQRILQESEHRVKNMLTVVQAIALQTAANSADMASFTAASPGASNRSPARINCWSGKCGRTSPFRRLPTACSAPKSSPAARASAGRNCCSRRDRCWACR